MVDSTLTLLNIDIFLNFLDPRVRQAAFEALLNIHRNGHKLDSGTYQDLCKALTDDYEGVRMVGLALVQVMAISYPEEKVRDESGTIQRWFSVTRFDYNGA